MFCVCLGYWTPCLILIVDWWSDLSQLGTGSQSLWQAEAQVEQIHSLAKFIPAKMAVELVETLIYKSPWRMLLVECLPAYLMTLDLWLGIPTTQSLCWSDVLYHCLLCSPYSSACKGCMHCMHCMKGNHYQLSWSISQSCWHDLSWNTWSVEFSGNQNGNQIECNPPFFWFFILTKQSFCRPLFSVVRDLLWSTWCLVYQYQLEGTE